MPDRSRILLSLILIWFAVLAGLFARSIPLFEASDEAEHFIYMDTILDSGSLPVIQSRAEMAAQADPVRRWNNQSHHAPLYYLLGSGLIAWSSRTDLADYLTPNELIFLRDTTANNPNKWLHPYAPASGDTHSAVYLLRGFNILLGMGTLLLIYLTGKTAFHTGTGLLAAFLVASIPTFIAVHASVTNDALVMLLYSAGLLWLVRVWQAAHITPRDMLLMSVIAGGAALTKLTGVSLYGVLAVVLAAGAWRGRWRRQAAAQAFAVALAGFALLAGWWYLRNWQLYGDPLGMAATASIWGRETPFTLALLPDELLRTFKSFWMMVGYLHQPVFGSEPFTAYTALISLAGLAGWVRRWRKNVSGAAMILLLAFVIVTAMMLYGTRSVDISYGRLLYPALAAAAVLLVTGWQSFAGRWAGVLVLPVALMAVYAPLVTLPAAYPTLNAVAAVPADATPIGWKAGDLEIVAARIPASTLQPGDTLLMDLYIRGSHPENPALLVTAVDSWRVLRFGHIEIFPGMAATSTLPAETLWRVPIRLAISTDDDIRAPRIAGLLVRWVNLEDDRALLFDNGRDLLELRGPVFRDPRYQAPTLPQTVDARFGDSIRLTAVEIPAQAQAGDSLTLAFRWDVLTALADDWTLTLQLFDTTGTLAAQIDETPYWYPTNAWLSGTTFVDTRTLNLPPDLPAGVYTVRAGWYRQVDDAFIRLNATAADVRDNLATVGQIAISAP